MALNRKPVQPEADGPAGASPRSVLLPQSREAFDVYFPSEEACHDYVRRLRWSDGFRCPACDARSFWRTRRGQFRCRHCQRQSSVTSGTLFDGSRKPLRDWLRAIWYVAGRRSGVSAIGLMRELDLHSYQTAWVWLHRLRQIMVCEKVLLDGRVEADLVTVGGPEDRTFATRWQEPSTVAVAVGIDGALPGRIRLRQISPNSYAEWALFLKDAVQPQATLEVRSPFPWPPAQPGLRSEPMPHVAHVETMLRRWMRGTYCGAVDSTYLACYLDEFTFRVNHRTATRAQLFQILLTEAIRSSPDQRFRPIAATRAQAGAPAAIPEPADAVPLVQTPGRHALPSAAVLSLT